MGVYTQIDCQQAAIEIQIVGELQGAEIIDTVRQLLDNPPLSRERYRIIDKSKCVEFNVSADEIESLAVIYQQLARRNPGLIVAVIESETLQFSLTDLWRAHLQGYPVKARAFRDRAAATAWIDQQLAVNNPLNATQLG